MVEVRGGRILVVNGDASARAVYASALRDAGHTVFETGRLADAAVLVRQIGPELLISSEDAGPGHHFLEFKRSIEQQDADVTLAEPVAPDVLLATVCLMLRLGRAERDLRDCAALERQARADAAAAARIKDDFLGTLSHELRTPLHAIVGWVTLLRTRVLNDESRAHALEVIARNAKAQTALIEDLLDVSRITLGQLQLTWTPVELVPVMVSAVDAISPTAETRHVTIATDIALEPEFTVRGDATRLRQIFWILLSNAVKFTPEGGRVDVRARAANGRAEIEVIDNGRGISAEFLPLMFERFQRADLSTTTSDRGLGLGLAIARQLVELHGGELTAASAGLNRGATFSVALPQFAAREATTREASTDPDPRRESAPRVAEASSRASGRGRA